MFIITKEKCLRARDVVGVFDLDTATVSGVTKNFLISAEKAGEIEGINNLPKSFILAGENKKNKENKENKENKKDKIYLSARLAGYVVNHCLSTYPQARTC